VGFGLAKAAHDDQVVGRFWGSDGLMLPGLAL
jgi:hypothetical protein